MVVSQLQPSSHSDNPKEGLTQGHIQAVALEQHGTPCMREVFSSSPFLAVLYSSFVPREPLISGPAEGSWLTGGSGTLKAGFVANHE